jgi:hypothetical protein
MAGIERLVSRSWKEVAIELTALLIDYSNGTVKAVEFCFICKDGM